MQMMSIGWGCAKQEILATMICYIFNFELKIYLVKVSLKLVCGYYTLTQRGNKPLSSALFKTEQSSDFYASLRIQKAGSVKERGRTAGELRFLNLEVRPPTC